MKLFLLCLVGSVRCSLQKRLKEEGKGGGQKLAIGGENSELVMKNSSPACQQKCFLSRTVEEIKQMLYSHYFSLCLDKSSEFICC